MPAGPDRPGRRERPFCAAGRLARRPVRLTAPRDTNDNLMRGITSIGHVAIRVEEFERSLAFYVGKLGFSEMFRLDRDGPWIIYFRDGRSAPRAVFDAIGDRAAATENIGALLPHRG